MATQSTGVHSLIIYHERISVTLFDVREIMRLETGISTSTEFDVFFTFLYVFFFREIYVNVCGRVETISAYAGNLNMMMHSNGFLRINLASHSKLSHAIGPRVMRFERDCSVACFSPCV